MRLQERPPRRSRLLARDMTTELPEKSFDVREYVRPELAVALTQAMNEQLSGGLAKHDNDFYHSLNSFSLLFPDQQVGFSPEQKAQVFEHLASLKGPVTEWRKFGWYMVRLAMAFSAFPELRQVKSPEWWRVGPLARSPVLSPREIDAWVKVMDEQEQMRQARLGDVASIMVAKSILVISFLQPEKREVLRRLTERLVGNGVAKHGFALTPDVLSIQMDLRLVFPDLEFPIQPNQRTQESLVQDWKETVADPKSMTSLYTYTGSALYVLADQLQLDKEAKVRYNVRRQVRRQAELPHRTEV